MRRRRSSPVVAAIVLAVRSLWAAVAAGQSGLTTEGAPFLLIPVGARALGMGQAVVADQPGSEAVWWNPSGLARSEKREIAVHHYGSVVGNGDAITIVLPSSLLGVLAASVYVLNFGEQEIPDPNGVVVGAFTPLNLVYAATYATSVGSRLNAGISVKLVQLRINCSGACGTLPAVSSTTAIDMGAQYDARWLLPVTLGVAVRNVGPKLQVNDRDQADPLPTRIQFGALYRVTSLEKYSRDVSVRVSGDVIDELQLGSPTIRLGADAAYRQRAHLRAGYVFREIENSEQYGASLGLGLSAGNLQVDIARMFEGFAGASQPPTYLSLRYLF
ncbi:MAG: PorV/PorQ family protein [Anaerolineae bacterium]|nr:PorV/PorQ family protein [Gemmatimonadaceae bacterium]